MVEVRGWLRNDRGHFHRGYQIVINTVIFVIFWSCTLYHSHTAAQKTKIRGSRRQFWRVYWCTDKLLMKSCHPRCSISLESILSFWFYFLRTNPDCLTTVFQCGTTSSWRVSKTLPFEAATRHPWCRNKFLSVRIEDYNCVFCSCRIPSVTSKCRRCNSLTPCTSIRRCVSPNNNK